MSLQSQIREDMVAAMKTGNNEVRDFLRVVAGEFGREMNNGIELQDERVIVILKRMEKDAKLMGNLNEVEILDKYLPNLLHKEQIKTIIGGIIHKNQYSGMQDMGRVMSTIKTHPMKSQIDGKLASEITRELLTQ